MAGSQAFITPDSARFVFPRQPYDSYEWDVPIAGVQGGGGYSWDVSWETPADRNGIDPCELWLPQYWKSGGPRRGGLKQLIEWLRLQPMVKSTKDLSGFDRLHKVDYRKVFATVQNGQLVFIVRGADAVRQIFPTIPSRVTFRAITAKGPPRRWGVASAHDYKTVIVNDPNSPDIPETRRSKCDNIGDDPNG
ncbi:MAG TPA: hypothetical protein VK565_11435 [Gemmatimonadaceae bacterium]|nr:hypothetical protein [Gemmatimonadaceae bacterium]